LWVSSFSGFVCPSLFSYCALFYGVSTTYPQRLFFVRLLFAARVDVVRCVLCFAVLLQKGSARCA
jgi:hypothetical protein